MGLLAKIFDLNVPKLTKLIEERFGGKDPTVVQNAMTCFNAGYNHSLENLLKTYQFYTPDKKDRHQVVMNGNEALGLRIDRRGRAFRRGLSHHAVVGHHGTAPARTAEIRRHVCADRG